MLGLSILSRKDKVYNRSLHRVPKQKNSPFSAACFDKRKITM